MALRYARAVCLRNARPKMDLRGGSQNFDAKPLDPNTNESHHTNDTNQVPKSYAANITALKLPRFYYDNLAALAAGEVMGVELAELKPFNSWMACIKQLKLLCCEFCRPSKINENKKMIEKQNEKK